MSDASSVITAVPQPQVRAPAGWTTPALLLLALAAMTLSAIHQMQVWVWIFALLGIVFGFCMAGIAITGRAVGVLIDERNVMSLSRVQLASWSLLVLSGFAAAAWIRLFAEVRNPLQVVLDERLWVLMGISTTSLVASPLLLNDRKGKSADPAQVAQTTAMLVAQGTDGAQVSNMGRLYANKTKTAAAWSDLITGEEVTNAAHIDLSRLQMLFFTVVVLVVFAADLARYFIASSPESLGSNFPVLDESMVALIGISHTGYLASKAVDKPPTA